VALQRRFWPLLGGTSFCSVSTNHEGNLYEILLLMLPRQLQLQLPRCTDKNPVCNEYNFATSQQLTGYCGAVKTMQKHAGGSKYGAASSCQQ
jgi:hypothetical protein